MRIAVTGVTGQVGWELQRALQPYGDVVALDRSALDLKKPEELSATLRRVKPDVIFNPAAFTAVDLAESQPEAARRINQDAVGVIAHEAAALGAPTSSRTLLRQDASTGAQNLAAKGRLRSPGQIGCAFARVGSTVPGATTSCEP
jgi:nucleoside-diphosphate-sugar epimerase